MGLANDLSQKLPRPELKKPPQDLQEADSALVALEKVKLLPCKPMIY